MSNEKMGTPPECCPVCQMPEDWRDTDDGQLEGVTYKCGARWVVYTHGEAGWMDGCPHALAAALRCHATLHPTALETARAAVVAAAKLWAQSVAGDDLPIDPDVTLFNAVSAVVALECQP